MAALFHLLTTQTPAQNGAQAGLPPSTHPSDPSHLAGNGHGEIFAAMISAQTDSTTATMPGLSQPTQHSDDHDFQALTFQIGQTQRLFAEPAADGRNPDVALTGKISEQPLTGKPPVTLVSETPERANITTIEPTISRPEGEYSLPRSDNPAKIIGSIIAEPSNDAGIAVIESPASLKTAPVAIGAPLTDHSAPEEDGLVIAKTPDRTRLAGIEPQTIDKTRLVSTGAASAEITAPIIAETPDIADIAEIERGEALALSSYKADVIPIAESVSAAELTSRPHLDTAHAQATIVDDLRMTQAGPVVVASQDGTVPQNAASPTQAAFSTGGTLPGTSVTLVAPNQIQPGRTATTRATMATPFEAVDGQTLPDSDTAPPSREAAALSPPASSPAAETAQQSASTPSPMAAIAHSDRPVTSDQNQDMPAPAKTKRTDATANAESTADNRAATKTAASSTAAPTDLPQGTDAPKVTDAPKMTDAPTLPTANSDPAAPIKTLPVMTSLPPVTPMSALSDRLAATILQTTHAPQSVTLDKVPQAVVAVALSAKSATLQIDPPELGRIQLDYQFDTQGRTVVTLTPESDAARAALIDRMALITASLERGSNSPVDVKLAEARDFGAALGQASQDGNGEDSRSGSQGSRSHAGSDSSQAQALQGFTRAPAGEDGRLHILV